LAYADGTAVALHSAWIWQSLCDLAAFRRVAGYGPLATNDDDVGAGAVRWSLRGASL